MNNTQELLRCSRRGCSYTTNRSYNLERHERNHDKGKVPVSQCQPCPHCTYAAGSVHNLMRHISNKHAIVTVKKQKGQLICSQLEQQSIEKSGKREDREETEEQEENAAQQLWTIDEGQILKPSLWLWNTPQQQEKNFLRRSALNEECKILGRTVKMFKLYSLVKARGGALNVDDWDDVAAILGFGPGLGQDVRAKYMDVLIEYEKNEEQRLQDCENAEEVPSWWDDGDFTTDYESCKPEDSHLGSESGMDEESAPMDDVESGVVDMIFNNYYANYLNNSKPFSNRFRVKDSWLCATMLSYQELICQLHFKHKTDS